MGRPVRECLGPEVNFLTDEDAKCFCQRVHLYNNDEEILTDRPGKYVEKFSLFRPVFVFVKMTCSEMSAIWYFPHLPSIILDSFARNGPWGSV
jgi:hypothetical protein